MKRIAARISLILLLALLFSLASVPASAEPELVAYGYCGDEAIWALDSEGLLHISGSGAIYEYGDAALDLGNGIELPGAPWYPHMESIKALEVDGGITRIGTSAFRDLTALESVSFHEGLEEIGPKAFYGCHALKTLTFPRGMRALGDQCFTCCVSLKEVYMPAGLTELGEGIFACCDALETITLPEDLQEIAVEMFAYDDSLTQIDIPPNVTRIGGWALYGSGLESVTIPASVRLIEPFAFGENAALRIITFQGSAPQEINYTAFSEVEATVYYPGHNVTWTQNQRGNYRGSLTWIPYDGGVEQYGYLVNNAYPSDSVIEVDGKRVYPDQYGDFFLETEDAKVLVWFKYNTLEGDVHGQYPVGMVTYLLSFRDGEYQKTDAGELRLSYAGSSIRVTGKKGIRMITSMNSYDLNQLLLGDGEFTVLEYGTVVAWDSELNGDPLTLEQPAAKSAYAYLRGEADQRFKVGNGEVQYTNVLVGFTNDQCIPDLSMRPYMKLQDRDGNVLVIYGGTIHRSIGYIALQNRNAFQPGTTSYEYIWGIIHHVYGTAYDAEYKG